MSVVVGRFLFKLLLGVVGEEGGEEGGKEEEEEEEEEEEGEEGEGQRTPSAMVLYERFFLISREKTRKNKKKKKLFYLNIDILLYTSISSNV